MIAERTVLAIVPARGGSKGVRRKNLRDVAGKPLIGWTIEAACRSAHIDRVILSSDDDEIMEVARSFGCDVPFRRPPELATDEAHTTAVVRHALGTLDQRYDYVVLLQPTSPLRQTADVDGAITACHERQAPSCVSLSPVDKPPAWMFTVGNGNVLRPFLQASEIPARRQDTTQLFALNGAVYVATCSLLEATNSFIAPGSIGYVMPRERALDVDDEFDLKLAILLMRDKA